jgi:topoisomerase-4 subunit A
MVRGPDFPTGGIIVDIGPRSSTPTRPAAAVPVARPLGDRGSGQGHLGDRRHRNSPTGAEVEADRKDRRPAGEPQALPLLEDVRDESAEDIRLVLVPKSRTVEPALLMESLFKLTELESRFRLNMNVLSRGKVPNVLSLKEVLREWLDHRKRGAGPAFEAFRLAEIERRLEISAAT